MRIIIRCLVIPIVVCLGCSFEDQRPLKVATNLWPGYEPLYLAQYLGFFDRHVDMIQLMSATEVIRAFNHGNIDAAGLTLDEAILLKSKGVDLVTLLILDLSVGGDAIMVMDAPMEAGSLKGLTVGVENTALGAIVLSEALKQMNLTVADIDIKNVSADSHEQALLSNQVQAVVTFEPIKARLLEQGAKILFDTSMAPDLVLDVLVVRKSVLQQKPEQVKTLIQGYFDARQYMLTHHSDSSAFFLKRLNLSLEQLETAFASIYLPTREENKDWFSGQPSKYEVMAQRVLRIMHERNLVAKDVSVTQQYDPSEILGW